GCARRPRPPNRSAKISSARNPSAPPGPPLVYVYSNPPGPCRPPPPPKPNGLPSNPPPPWRGSKPRGFPCSSISPRSNFPRLSLSPRMSYAPLISLNFFTAASSPPCLSGWYFLASERKAFLISASLAFFETPNTLYGSAMFSPAATHRNRSQPPI